MTNYDVIVVGAGFAGATAAREFATRGLKTLIIEAKDRIGGRSGSRVLSDGTIAEVGGTFMHWTQPHLMAELTRYKLDDQLVAGSVEAEWLALYENGETTWTLNAESEALNRSAFEKLLPAALEVFPHPSEPFLAREALEAADKLNVAEGLATIDLTDDERAVLEMTLAAWAGRSTPEAASWTNALRWIAMGRHTYDGLQSFTIGQKLKCGTGGLISAILADGGTELRLNTVVSSIHSDAEGVTVTLADGEVLTAKASVIAVPSNVWASLDLSPALSPLQREASEVGMSAEWSAKAVAVIKGEKRSLTFSGDDTLPLGFFTQAFRGEDEQVLAMYPSDPNLSLDEATLRDHITRALPHVTVLAAGGDKYLADDPAFLGAWSAPGPGQLTKYVPHENFTRLDERVVFATSDISKYFHSWVDGAIESGLRAAADIRVLLEGAPADVTVYLPNTPEREALV